MRPSNPRVSSRSLPSANGSSHRASAHDASTAPSIITHPVSGSSPLRSRSPVSPSLLLFILPRRQALLFRLREKQPRMRFCVGLSQIRLLCPPARPGARPSAAPRCHSRVHACHSGAVWPLPTSQSQDVRMWRVMDAVYIPPPDALCPGCTHRRASDLGPFHTHRTRVTHSCPPSLPGARLLRTCVANTAVRLASSTAIDRATQAGRSRPASTIPLITVAVLCPPRREPPRRAGV